MQDGFEAISSKLLVSSHKWLFSSINRNRLLLRDENKSIFDIRALILTAGIEEL